MPRASVKSRFAPAEPQRGIRDNSLAAGMRAFFAIAEKWGLSTEEAIALLGHPSRATYFAWKKGRVGHVAHSFDLASRISYVLGIFKALEILYQRPEMADQWVRRPNKAFGGQSAIERMRAGHMVDLAAVRTYLDSVRGGW
ncbi:MAG TPA: MbcA/ParS/Xre antitoxin family protein [Hyphomicrobiaceae bacterium]|nr:MbcA/ParS/Xre antitoxin family protein [Hyphomicrobiaceae bacterium]